MYDSIEINRKDNGYSVEVVSEHDHEYNVEELVFQDPLDVLAEVLRWLGYDEDDVSTVTEMLDDDVAYVLTDKGREALAQLERERAGTRPIRWTGLGADGTSEASEARAEQDWKQADRDWEIRRLEAELAALKRGSGRGLLERGTRGYWHTTETGANTAGEDK